jgi:hypothetical protein
MTEVAGSVKQLGQGQTQKTFKYDALGSLVDIVFNTAGKLELFSPVGHILTCRLGQVVSAVVQKATGGSGGGASPSSAQPSPSATPKPVTLPVSSTKKPVSTSTKRRT